MQPSLEAMLECSAVTLSSFFSRFDGTRMPAVPAVCTVSFGFVTRHTKIFTAAGLHTLDFGACLALTDMHLAAIPPDGWSRILNINISRCWSVTRLWPTSVTRDLGSPVLSNEMEPAPTSEVSPLPFCSSDVAQASKARVSRVERLATPLPAPSLSSLRVLNVHGCEGLVDIAGLSVSGASLTGLDIGACTGITDLSVLATLTNLQVLRCGSGRRRAKGTPDILM